MLMFYPLLSGASFSIVATSNLPVGIVTFRNEKKKKYMRCDICQKYPNIVKQFHPRGHVPMASTGTQYRLSILQDHIQSDYHKECERLNRISSVAAENIQTPLTIAIDKANLQSINHVSSLMMQIYFDAKHLNLSASSWPGRFVTNAASFAYNASNETQPTIPENIPMQYVNKPGHRCLLTTIVNSHIGDFMKKINESWAVSLRVDGSVDSTQIDKIYVMAKVINSNGFLELLFIGIAEQKERKALGLMKATMNAIETVIGTDNRANFLKNVSSICTDGTNVNTGQKNSLWAELDKEMKTIKSQIPLNKIWCGAHRAELVWGDTASKIRQVNKVLSVLGNISSHFHKSPHRTTELEQIGEEYGVKVNRLPKLHTVRWCQFSFSLLRSVLISWEALVRYLMKHPENADAVGFLRYLTTVNNLKLIAFMADVLFVYQRFQKMLQSDRLTIISLMSNIASLKKQLEKMESSPLAGGFEKNLYKQMYWCSPNGKMILKEIVLHETESWRETQSFAEIRKEILCSIREFLDSRFEADDAYVKSIEPFINFNANTNIEDIHAQIAPDLSLPNLSLQFEDIASNPNVYENLSVTEIIVKLCKTTESMQNFKELITVFARIAAATPHSADVERNISADHRLKSNLRTSMNLETENKYLYVHYNMPVLAEWKPANAAKLFFSEKTRRERDASTSVGSKSREQSYFKGVFPEAQNSVDPDDENDDNEDEQVVFEF